MNGERQIPVNAAIIQAGKRVKIVVWLLSGKEVVLECLSGPQVIPGVVLFPIKPGRAKAFSLTAILGWEQVESEIAVANPIQGLSQ